MHALTGDGSRYGRMMAVHERGMDAAECARRLLTAVASGKEEALVGGWVCISVHLLRFSRRLVSALMRRHPVRRLDALRRVVSFGRVGGADRQRRLTITLSRETGG